MKRGLPFVILAAAILVAAIIVFQSLVILRLRRAIAQPRPAPPPPVARRLSDPPMAPAASPREAVVSYLEALDRGDHRNAYACLSAASRQAHPYQEFLKLCEKGEATGHDVAAARELPAGEDRVTVMIPLAEDPAEASFVTAREAGGWVVIFIGGAPWFPYP
jgi:hypothetical protein